MFSMVLNLKKTKPMTVFIPFFFSGRQQLPSFTELYKSVAVSLKSLLNTL